MFWKFAGGGGAFVLLPAGALLLLGLTARPPEFGAPNGALTPCSRWPNGVCSQAADAGHYVEPPTFANGTEALLRNLKGTLKDFPRTIVVEERVNYLRAEVRTALFGFVDDLEFLAD